MELQNRSKSQRSEIGGQKSEIGENLAMAKKLIGKNKGWCRGLGTFGFEH